MQEIKLSTIKNNPDNPRVLKDAKFKKLKKSIEDFPQMMELRPIVVDENNTILGGNMRFKALKDLGYTNVPSNWIKQARGLTDQQKREFVIKDNSSFGEWDWDVLANEWNVNLLNEWGMDLPDFDFDDAFEEEKEEKDEPFEIKLKYNEDDYHAVVKALKTRTGTKEDIIAGLLGV